MVIEIEETEYEVLACQGNVYFCEYGYIRKHKYYTYKDGSTITICGKTMSTHRWIAYAGATEWQQQHFPMYDAHHIYGHNAPLTFYSIELLTANMHRRLHSGKRVPAAA